LIINVRIDFEGLCSGFGSVSGLGNEKSVDNGIYNQADSFKTSYYHKNKVLFHTAGHVVESLKPMPLEYDLKSRITGGTLSRGSSSRSGSGFGFSFGNLFNFGIGVGLSLPSISLGVSLGVSVSFPLLSTIQQGISSVKTAASNAYNSIKNLF
jgi:hypothetical protein